MGKGTRSGDWLSMHSITIKNTFINVDGLFPDELFDCDCGLGQMGSKRQVSEPAPVRQVDFEPVSNSGSSSAGGSGDEAGMEGEAQPPQQLQLELLPQDLLELPEGHWVGLEHVQDSLPGEVLEETMCNELLPVPPEWAGTLTVMMRNLPNRYSQHMLLDEIARAGFARAFDFLYLPIDQDTKANKGYAFINFLDDKQSWMFKAAFEGRQLRNFRSSKLVSVNPAMLQGLEANYAHYSRARCSRGDPAARPIFLREPVREAVSHHRAAGGHGRRGRGGHGGRGARRTESLVDAAARERFQHTSPTTPQAAALQHEALQSICSFCGGHCHAACCDGQQLQRLRW